MDPAINVQHETLETIRHERHHFHVALVRVMANSEPLNNAAGAEAWDHALSLLSKEDKRQVFGS